MTLRTLPRLLVRVLCAPLSAMAAGSLVSLTAALSVLAPAPWSEAQGHVPDRLYELAFLDTVVLGATVLAVASPWGTLFERLAPASRLALEAALLVASTWVLLTVVLLLQNLFVPSGRSALWTAARAGPRILEVGAIGVLLLRFRLQPALRALLLGSAAWILPALLPGRAVGLLGDSQITYGAEASLTFAPILGCLLAAWLCLARRTAHR